MQAAQAVDAHDAHRVRFAPQFVRAQRKALEHAALASRLQKPAPERSTKGGKSKGRRKNNDGIRESLEGRAGRFDG